MCVLCVCVYCVRACVCVCARVRTHVCAYPQTNIYTQHQCVNRWGHLQIIHLSSLKILTWVIHDNTWTNNFLALQKLLDHLKSVMTWIQHTVLHTTNNELTCSNRSTLLFNCIFSWEARPSCLHLTSACKSVLFNPSMANKFCGA